jgi:hypothetical protein
VLARLDADVDVVRVDGEAVGRVVGLLDVVMCSCTVSPCFTSMMSGVKWLRTAVM